MDGTDMIQDLHSRFMTTRYNVFHASMLIRHSNDGKLYLYDVIDIKKKRATLSANKRLPDKKPISFREV